MGIPGLTWTEIYNMPMLYRRYYADLYSEYVKKIEESKNKKSENLEERGYVPKSVFEKSGEKNVHMTKRRPPQK